MIILKALVAIKMYRIVHTGGKSQEGGAILGMIQPLAFRSPANHTAPLAATNVEAYSKSQVSIDIFFQELYLFRPIISDLECAAQKSINFDKSQLIYVFVIL